MNDTLKQALILKHKEIMSKNKKNKAIFLASRIKKINRNNIIRKAKKMAILSNELNDSLENLFFSLSDDARNLAEGLSFYISKTIHYDDREKIIKAMNREVEKFLTKYKDKVKKIVERTY